MPVEVEGNVSLLVSLADGRVALHPSPLYVNIAAFKYDIGGKRGTYNGAVAQLMTNNSTNYLYLDKDAALQKNTTGFPTTGTYIPLARIVCSSGEVVAIHEERVLLASSSSSIGTCKISFPVDGDIRGGGTTASSNNDIAAIRFDHTTDGWNRINRRPPQNYVSGDLTFRIYCSVPSTLGSNKDTKWKIEYAFLSLTDSLPSSWPFSDTQVIELDGQLLDKLFPIDLTIDSDNFDNTKDLMCIKVTRMASDAQDNCGVYIYAHEQELRYSGYLIAGQPGQ